MHNRGGNRIWVSHTLHIHFASKFIYCVILLSGFLAMQLNAYSCNSSYLEKTERIKKLDSPYPHKEMVVVTEWEEFGANVSRLLLLFSFPIFPPEDFMIWSSGVKYDTYC